MAARSQGWRSSSSVSLRRFARGIPCVAAVLSRTLRSRVRRIPRLLQTQPVFGDLPGRLAMVESDCRSPPAVSSMIRSVAAKPTEAHPWRGIDSLT